MGSRALNSSSKSPTYLGWIAAFFLASCSPLASEPRSCADSMFAVDAADSELVAEICDLAPRIRDELVGCGLIQTRPLVLKVVQELSHTLGNCLAWYDCNRTSISLIDPARYGEVIERDSPYARLPPNALLGSVLTHELTHALITQSAGTREIALVDQEYIAAALELELMDSEWRDVLISAAPVSPPPKAGLIDIWIYALEPRKFATNAWQHFRMAENGCRLVRSIVQGEATLSRSSR